MPRLYVRDEAIEIGEIPTVSARFHKDRFHRSLSRRLFLEADPVSGAFALPAPAANATSGALGDSREAYGIRRANSVLVQRLDEKYSDSGQVGFKGIRRTDGRPLLTSAAVLIKHSTTWASTARTWDQLPPRADKPSGARRS